MKPAIRAIETEFNGYRFRSRLEARWAVFFSELGIRYRYEPEGFEMDGLKYLPDFWLPNEGWSCFDRKGAWLEIKPEYPTALEIEKISRLAKLSGRPTYLFFGEVGEPDEHAHGLFFSEWCSPHPGSMAWTECPACGAVGICGGGWLGHLPCDGCGNSVRTRDGKQECVLGCYSLRLRRAYAAARSARFERYPRNMRRALEDGGAL
jgi:hypothetical protein